MGENIESAVRLDTNHAVTVVVFFYSAWSDRKFMHVCVKPGVKS